MKAPLAPLAAALGLCLALGGCGPLGSYGPAQDHSRFEGAVLMPGRTVLLSFSHLVYRPATGITAFPDGGVPRYLEDEVVLAAYDIPSGALRELRRERNTRWASGQGRYGIQRAKGSVALVTQGGQLRRDLATTAYEDWLVDAVSGGLRPVDWRATLAERGLAMTELHLVDERGTLLFVTRPAGSDRRARGDGDVRLWIRTPAGELLQVAQTSHFQGVRGDDVVYWVPETRRTLAFDLATRANRELPDYRLPPVEDPVEGVSIEAGGQRLLFGRRGPGGWEHEPLPLEPARLKRPAP